MATKTRATRKSRSASPPRREATQVEIDGQTLTLTNRGKIYFPATGFTKGDVLDYYAAVAPVMLPHFRDRAVTLVRYPDGVEGTHFFEKNCPTYRPSWLETTKVPKEDGGTVNFCVLDDTAALLWVANLGAIELHPYLHRGDDTERPTMLVIDLDPGPERAMKDCAKLALDLREMLAGLGLEMLAKASGGKGIHLAVPLNGDATYDDTRAFAHALAKLLEAQRPKEVTATMAKAKRHGRILIDWSQNNTSKTTAGAYSLRARAEPSVSMPLTWDDVESIARSRKKKPIDLSPQAALKRVDRLGDLWAPTESRKQSLPKL